MSQCQTDASQSAIKKKKTHEVMRDFLTEDKSEWRALKSFPLNFQASIVNGKIQISKEEGERIVYKPRNRITVNKREGLFDNIQRKKEGKKHSRSKPREGNFRVQEGMKYCLTDIPTSRIPMIFNDKYLGNSMENLYQHHKKTNGMNWDHTHDKKDYLENVVLEELKQTYRFLEIMQRPEDESDSESYTSAGNLKI